MSIYIYKEDDHQAIHLERRLRQQIAWSSERRKKKEEENEDEEEEEEEEEEEVEERWVQKIKYLIIVD